MVDGVVLENLGVGQGDGHKAPVFPLAVFIVQVDRQAAADAHAALYQIKGARQEQLALFNGGLGLQIALADAGQIQPRHGLVALQGENALDHAAGGEEQAADRRFLEHSCGDGFKILVAAPGFDEVGLRDAGLGHLGQQSLVCFSFNGSGDVFHPQPVLLVVAKQKDADEGQEKGKADDAGEHGGFHGAPVLGGIVHGVKTPSGV